MHLALGSSSNSTSPTLPLLLGLGLLQNELNSNMTNSRVNSADLFLVGKEGVILNRWPEAGQG